MTVISLTLTESEEQVIYGVPKTVSVEANIPSTIFYTLDETTPTTESNVYLEPITLPTNVNSVVLKVFATNGSDESAVLTKNYNPGGRGAGYRYTHAKLAGQPDVILDNFPFGSNVPLRDIRYSGAGGEIVDNPEIENIGGDGYDADGNLVKTTDEEIPIRKFIFSETDNKGQRGRGIGTLPLHSLLIPVPGPISTTGNANSAFFNPKANIIIQDSTQEEKDGIPFLNKNLYIDSSIYTERSGANLFNNSFEGSNISGSFVRSYFNYANQTLTFFYRNSSNNNWIISTEKFEPSSNNKSLGSMVSGKNNHVYLWLPFQRRSLG